MFLFLKIIEPDELQNNIINLLLSYSSITNNENISYDTQELLEEINYRDGSYYFDLNNYDQKIYLFIIDYIKNNLVIEKF